MTKEQKITDVLYQYDLIEVDERCMNNITGAMIEVQKFNYWRGFRACMILVVVPGAVAFVVFCNTIINLAK